MTELPDTPNGKLVVYLMSCYLYYVEDVHVLGDCQFDDLCEALLRDWDLVTHPHKNLTTREDLAAGTGYAIKYPKIVVGAARHWYRQSTRERSK